MFWKRLLFFLYLSVGATVFLLVASRLAAPGVISYFRLATGRASERRIQIVRMKSHWNQSVMQSEIYWNVRFSGGPLGHRNETIIIDQPAATLLRAQGRFHVGDWVQAVPVLDQWIPPFQAKLQGMLGIPSVSLLALAVFGLILRGAVGPRAFPEHYEPATVDIGSNITGFPTRRPLAIVVVLLVGFFLSVWQILFKASSFLTPGERIGYWQGLANYLLFLLACPIVCWAALPRLRRVQPR